MCAPRVVSARILAVASIAAVAGVALPSAAAPVDAGTLDALVAPLFRADGPGATVLVKKGDQVLLRKGYGMANLELGVAMRPEFVLRLGSVTKQFTAAAIMILADEGKLSLRDDVRKYVPGYPAKSAVVTLEQLLTHTSGVPDYTERPAFKEHQRDDLTHAEVLAMIKDLPLDFAPGEKWAYSNSGYYLLGLVIEKVSGKSYADFIADRIFRPLGMKHSRYGDDAPIIQGRVQGYERAADGFTNAAPLSMRLPFAAGALVSSVDDLALWDRAIRDGKLLRKASWTRVFTPEHLKDGSSTGYGFGWMTGVERGHRIVWHNGGINGFSTMIVRLPDDDVVAVVLCNSVGGADPGIARKLALTAAGVPLPAAPTAIAVDARTLERYVGAYELAPDFVLKVTRENDHLFAQATGQPRAEIFASAPAEFFLKVVDAQLSFHVDANGHADSLVLHQGGRDLPAKRVP